MTNLADHHRQVSVCSQQVEEPKGSLSFSNNTLACMIYVSKLSPPLPYSFTGHFWSSRAEPSTGLQELAATRVNQLWLLIYRLKRRPPAQAEGRAAEAAES